MGQKGGTDVRVAGVYGVNGGALAGRWGPAPKRSAAERAPGGVLSFNQTITPEDLSALRAKAATAEAPDEIDPDLARLLRDI